ncbi:MAG: hypothetical protein NVS1B7_5980 [Candidatus Saccharimonadales bacterium]
MAKIMLVEDDNNLREIYEARLLAEGYEIVSAKDGEEALAMAIKEKPDLIISDVMMPKISGFDMLDILRSTPETKDTRVIMMTALSQAEDKARASKLGADRYLVKSQVTLEDVAKVARDVLEGNDETPAPALLPPADVVVADQMSASENLSSLPVSEPPAAATPGTVDDHSSVPLPTPVLVSNPSVTANSAAPADTNTVVNTPSSAPVSSPAASSEPVNQSLVNPTQVAPSANSSLVDQGSGSMINELSQSMAAEEAAMDAQINSIITTAPVEANPAPAAPIQVPVPESDATNNEPNANSTIDLMATANAPTTIPVADAPFDNTAAVTTKAAALVETVNNILQTPATNLAPNNNLDPQPTSAPPITEPTSPSTNFDSVPVAHKKIIEPINQINQAPDLNDLLAKEAAKESQSALSGTGVINPNASAQNPLVSQEQPKNTSTTSPTDPNNFAL